jgi:hypothetical protein
LTQDGFLAVLRSTAAPRHSGAHSAPCGGRALRLAHQAPLLAQRAPCQLLPARKARGHELEASGTDFLHAQPERLRQPSTPGAVAWVYPPFNLLDRVVPAIRRLRLDCLLVTPTQRPSRAARAPPEWRLALFSLPAKAARAVNVPRDETVLKRGRGVPDEIDISLTGRLEVNLIKF